IATMEREAEGETVVLVQVRKENWLARTDTNAIAPSFWRYEWGDDPPVPAVCRSLPAALLVAEDDGDTVRMRARDGRVAFDAVELFGYTVCTEVNEIVAQWLRRGPHTPRVTIGDLTIAREQWTLSPRDI